MSENGKVITLPRGWPIGDWCPLKDVIDRMTQGEVGKLIADVKRELDFLATWNERRSEPQPKPDFYDGVPPPKSMDEYDWRVRSRAR